MTIKMLSTLGVISSYTGLMVTDNFDDIYEVLGHVLIHPRIMTHELPAGMRSAKPFLEMQHPWLKDFKAPERDSDYLENLKALCAEAVEVHGETVPVNTYLETVSVPISAVAESFNKVHKPVEDVQEILDRLFVNLGLDKN